MKSIIFSENKEIDTDQLMGLYTDAGWGAYTANPGQLSEAIKNSLLVLTAWNDGRLVGLIRVIGDGLTIIYIQDLLVLKDFKRKGIGKRLLKSVCERYSSVRQIILLTDNDSETKLFYEKVGLVEASNLNLCSYVKINKINS